jgi:hypothetical protein
MVLMALTVTPANPGETALFTVIRAALLVYLPTGTEVFRGQINRVPEPKGANFVVCWPINWQALSTPRETYTDVYPDPGSNTTVVMGRDVVIQMDVHGPLSADNATLIQTLSRSMIFSETVAAITTDVAVLYADDPRQSPFDNAENQFEMRWTIDLHVQANSLIVITQDFFDTATAGVINVDATYPP